VPARFVILGSASPDLILSKGFKIIAGIEIKHSNAPRMTKGNTLAIDTIQSSTNYIITPSAEDYPIRHNVQVCSLHRFIFHHLPVLVMPKEKQYLVSGPDLG